ncbi:MAG: beta-ketoacyl synthase chain length factor [Alcaligenaceae bacterium]|nr:beta-ketoacyl synthase chain length factor [Alcaligenaceae bacterium]
MLETTFHLQAASVLAPDLPNLDALFHTARTHLPIHAQMPLQLPAPAKLPANERRRASQAVRLVLACLHELETQTGQPVSSLRSIFATNDGTGEISQRMLETLATTREISPLVFPNSVHNAAAGYFSIAYKNHQPSTVISQGKDSFAAGLLCALTEALALNEPVLLVCFDPAMTGPMLEQLPIHQATACALVVSTRDTDTPPLAKIHAKLSLDEQPDHFPDWLPSEWQHQSAAYGFSVLGCIATRSTQPVRLKLGKQTLSLTCQTASTR